MTKSKRKRVLITGSSAGIGHATALAFSVAGYSVYASARRLDSIADLKERGLTTLALDVTDEGSMIRAVRTIESEGGALDVLVNNAGYSQMGPIEEVSIEQVRGQFETNVFGLIRLSQLVLPGMRSQGRGHIVNISSMGGEFTTPFAGIYHASKYALESISDALRFEVQPFGIRVVVIQPGVVNTRSTGTVAADLEVHTDSPYFSQMEGFRRFLAEQSAERSASTLSSESVAEVIVGAVGSEESETRYKVGDEAIQIPQTRRRLSDREWDSLFRDQFKGA